MTRLATKKRSRSNRIADMTTDEFQTMLDALIDRKMGEWLRDPDAGLEIRPEIVAGLLQQEKEFAAGKRGKPLSQVIRELEIE